MKPTFKNTVFAGIIGTIVMTIVTFLAPYMGLPKMSPPEMLASMMGFPVIVGWIAHFMIGIIFAVGYSYLFLQLLKTSNLVVKGVLFGIAVFIFAQIMMALMGALLGGIPKPEGGMAPLIMGSLIGHIMYGVPVAFIAKPQSVQAAQ